MFKIKFKWLLSSVLACLLVFSATAFNSTDASENLIAKKKQQTEAQAKNQETAPSETVIYKEVAPLDVVTDSIKYLNQNIKMNAVFDKFSTLGLDYNPALRETANYIGFLIQRDDVLDHNVPLSEMKLFLKREYAEKLLDLETGDKIEIKGNVFSAALGDPWIDVNEITILKKAKAEEENKETKK